MSFEKCRHLAISFPFCQQPPTFLCLRKNPCVQNLCLLFIGQIVGGYILDFLILITLRKHRLRRFSFLDYVREKILFFNIQAELSCFIFLYSLERLILKQNLLFILFFQCSSVTFSYRFFLLLKRDGSLKKLIFALLFLFILYLSFARPNHFFRLSVSTSFVLFSETVDQFLCFNIFEAFCRLIGLLIEIKIARAFSKRIYFFYLSIRLCSRFRFHLFINSSREERLLFILNLLPHWVQAVCTQLNRSEFGGTL